MASLLTPGGEAVGGSLGVILLLVVGVVVVVVGAGVVVVVEVSLLTLC